MPCCPLTLYCILFYLFLLSEQINDDDPTTVQQTAVPEPQKPSFQFTEFNVCLVFEKPETKIFNGFCTPLLTHFTLYQLQSLNELYLGPVQPV